MNKKIQEAEVSLRIAIHYIQFGKTNEDVEVAIDGAQIKTGNKVHFDIEKFAGETGLTLISNDESWRGTYSISGYEPRIIVHSYPGKGDVVIKRPDGQVLYVESKKGNLSKGKVSTEYALMREAIGQLMTCEVYDNSTELAVAVPHSDKSKELATRWSRLPQIINSGIRFLLVDEVGNVLKI